ncbi:hypothetical protein M2277_002763 [Paenibacillus sp. LBL]|uniref:hypothetical protein n=1 Tax=Paenibacillus TaxID=44249 RepID=UPI0024748151|nr:hypothetical protein [Paenibacillus sp. LBL]MDH6672101.1 hypothetical protein [Paenibacillus sp. LBL]
MTKFLDARTSNHWPIAFPGSMERFVVDTPVMVGQVGLSVPADTTGILRTQLLGQVGFYILSEDIFAPIIQIDVMRGYLTTDPVIHTTYVQYQPSQVQSQSVSFVAADYNVTPPPTGLLVYTMYVTALVLDMGRTGAECFNASVYTD